MSGPSESSSLSDLDSDDLLPPPLPNKPPEPKPKAVRVRKRKSTASTTTTIVTNGTATTTTTTVETTETPPKQKRQRKKKEKEPIMPLAPRVPSLLKIGAHVSAAKGVYNSVTNAVHIGLIPHRRMI